MRKVIYIVKTANYTYETTDYNVIKDLPQSAYKTVLREIRPEEAEKDRQARLERIKKRLNAIALHKVTAGV